MAKGIYVGVGGVAKKVKSLYVGVGGVAKKVKKAYIGVGGVPKLVWQSGIYTDTLVTGKSLSESTTPYYNRRTRKVLALNDSQFVEVFASGHSAQGIAYIRIGTFNGTSISYGAALQIDRADKESGRGDPNQYIGWAVFNNRPIRLYKLSETKIAMVGTTFGYNQYGDYNARVYYLEFTISGTTITRTYTEYFSDGTIYGFQQVAYNVNTNKIYVLPHNMRGGYTYTDGSVRQYTVGQNKNNVYDWSYYLFQYFNGTSGYMEYCYSELDFNKSATKLIVVRSNSVNSSVTRNKAIIYNLSTTACTVLAESAVSFDGASIAYAMLASAELSDTFMLISGKYDSKISMNALRVFDYSNNTVKISSVDTYPTASYSQWNAYSPTYPMGLLEDDGVMFISAYNRNIEPFIRVEGTTISVLPLKSPYSKFGFVLGENIIWLEQQSGDILTTYQTYFV